MHKSQVQTKRTFHFFQQLSDSGTTDTMSTEDKGEYFFTEVIFFFLSYVCLLSF